MTDLQQVTAWIDGYVKAWNSNDPADIGALFTEDADYHPEPYGEPWHGHDQIARQWRERGDEPGEATFTWEPVAVTADRAVVRGITTYPDRTYSNLWVVDLVPDGRCKAFTEWWMEHR